MPCGSNRRRNPNLRSFSPAVTPGSLQASPASRGLREVDMRGLSLLLLLTLAAPAVAADPTPVRITVAPATVELTGARDRQGVVVQAEYADGSTRDVTAAATFAFDKPVATATNGFVAPT